MGRFPRFLWAPLCALILVTVGCEAGDGTGEGDTPGDGAGGSDACLVGAIQACDCPGGFMGVQTCIDSPCDGAFEDDVEIPCDGPNA
ncbi:MAG: hypothetical protein VX938_10590, partial [Myxococcota bacterium]|nr:hypothetical protein [Myxococcota bacterium]